MFKENLRKKLIHLRKKNFKNQAINFDQFNRILKKLNLKNNINIGGYYPVNSEINCLDVLQILEKNNFKISLPITKKNNNMDFYKWSFQDSLSVSRQGIPEPNTRKKVLSSLGNVENKLFISINGTKLYATPEEDVDRTDNSGKTSSVHFIHFKFSDKQIEEFKNSSSRIEIGTDHDNYLHSTVLSKEVKEALAKDFR